MCVIQSGDIVKQYKYLESVEYYSLIEYCGLGQSESPGRFMALVGLVDLVRSGCVMSEWWWVSG